MHDDGWSPPHGGWARKDVSAVPPLSAYAARECPVRAQWDVLRPAEPEPVPEFVAALGRAGVVFEGDVYTELVVLHPGMADIDQARTREERERLTLDAIRDGAPLIAGGRLPVDEAGRRVAQPDLLVRVGTRKVDGRWRYVPIDVKHHGTLVADRGASVVVQPLDELRAPTRRDTRASVGRRDTGTTRNDLLQLAHYWRTLQAHGLAPERDVWAGVLGSEGFVAWYRLDEPMWQTPSTSSHDGRRTRTTLDVYDFEFGFRLDIVATAIEHRHDPDVPLLVQPVWIPECGTCPWRTHCRGLLEERQDVSLLPHIGWPAWSALSAHDATTMPALAVLPEDTVIEGLLPQAVANAIEEARARLGPDVAYRRRGVGEVVVARADVEVDVDMENVLGGAYLWGCLVTDRSGRGVAEDGYAAFADWDPDPQAAGVAAFLAFWAWLCDLRERCERAGLTFSAYCWHAPAENRWLKTGGGLAGKAAEVAGFVASPAWIDLRRVFQDQAVTGHATGLKDVATLLGFRWRDDTPGGDQSMLWWEVATDPGTTPDERDRFRRRLLDYNEDDVRATLHVREWLDRHARLLQPAPAP